MLPARLDADHDFYLSKVSYLGANLVRFISLFPMAPIIGFEILLNLPITHLDRTYTEDLTDVRFCLYNAIANSQVMRAAPSTLFQDSPRSRV